MPEDLLPDSPEETVPETDDLETPTAEVVEEPEILPDDDPELEEAEQTPRNRAQDRIRELIAENKALKSTMGAFQAPQTQAPPPPDLSRMEPEERRAYEDLQYKNQMNQNLGRLMDNQDRLEFQLDITSRHPEYAKYADQVEGWYHQSWREGRPVTRRQVLANIIGEEVLKRGNAPKGKGVRTVPNGTQVKSVTGKSKASGQVAKDEDAALEERMSRYTF